MAAGVVKILRSEVMCPLCLDVFVDPKRLPCEHVYCKDCLNGLALRSINKIISCPECRRDTVIPNLDVTTLPTAYQVNRLIEMYKESLVSVETEAECSTCEIHKSQSLTLFCKTCKSLVCPDCVTLLCATKHHECGPVDGMVEGFQAVMEREREPILVLHQQVSATLDAMVTTEREVLSTKDTRLQQVESTFDALSHILAKERSFCKESIEKFFQDQAHLYSKKRKLSELLSKLELLTKSIKKTSSKESKETFLASVAEKEEILQAAKMASCNLSSVPALLPEMIVNLHSPSELENTFKIENFFHRVRIEPIPELVSIGAASQFTLHFSPYKGRTESVEKIENITAEVICHDGSLQLLSIEKVAPEKYCLTFVPQGRGAHKLSIKYNNMLICGSPLPIYVTMQPEKLKKLSSTKPSSANIKNIAGIEYFEEKLYVSDPENGITILDALTKSISETVDLKGVGELVVEKDYFYGTDVTKHRLVKAKRDGTIMKSVGTKGTAPREFNHPKGIRISNNNELYVCDMANHRIQVFDKDLNFLRLIGDRGSGGCFRFPVNLAFDEAGNMYVTDQDNHRIQVLTPAGGHIRNIGIPGKKAGELYHPISVAVHKNMVYVADRVTKGISVFQTTGEFLTVFGKGALSHPQCIAVDEHGYIHVTDDKCKIVSF